MNLEDPPVKSNFPVVVPKSLIKSYARRGVKQLFNWQAECLSNERLFSPVYQNLVYTAPTSAGKTLVAEVIAACNTLQSGRRSLFIFPYISSAREKLFDLQTLWRSQNLVVKAFIGASSSSLHGWSAAVCTIEKANTLINAFIEGNILSEIGTIVVDELHMLFDNERGAIVESILSKILYASIHKRVNVQIIGMSATLEEHNLIGNWLNADIFVSNFRPLNLREYATIDGEIFDLVEKRPVRRLSEEFLIKSDIKCFIGMTVEALIEEKAVLVFCATKAETEKYASILGRYVQYCVSKGETNRFFGLGALLSPSHQQQIVEYFARKTFCTDRDLLGCISQGIAFHHAGLTVEEREEIEFLFRNGSLKVLVSTSTLSSGVNLPAHRVLILASMNSHIPLTSITYRQMVGRAGRQGQHKVVSGESYVLCTRVDWPIIRQQIERKPATRPRRTTARIILETISSEFVTNRDELESLLQCLLSEPVDKLEVELERLDELQLISIKPTPDEDSVQAETPSCTKRVVPTQLGRAVLASALSPGIAIQIFNDLDNATRSLCLDTELHMLFLVTPINNLAINGSAIDWNFFHQKWAELPEPLLRVSRRVGVSEKFFMQKLGGKCFARNDEALNLHIRFFAALVLHELINENPLEKVSRKFRINRGLLQSLQQQAATYAYMIVAFCDRLGWFYLKALLEGFAERLQFGVRRDLTELVRVQGVDAIRARHFHQNGIKSLAVLANAPLEEICRILRKAVPFPSNPNAEQSNNRNTWLFGEPLLEDTQAAQILVERAVNALKEKLEFAAFPSTMFEKNQMFMEQSSLLTGTTLSASRWLSDDDNNGSRRRSEVMRADNFENNDGGGGGVERVASETAQARLIHESAMEELCETFSPLRLNEMVGTMPPSLSQTPLCRKSVERAAEDVHNLDDDDIFTCVDDEEGTADNGNECSNFNECNKPTFEAGEMGSSEQYGQADTCCSEVNDEPAVQRQDRVSSSWSSSFTDSMLLLAVEQAELERKKAEAVKEAEIMSDFVGQRRNKEGGEASEVMNANESQCEAASDAENRANLIFDGTPDVSAIECSGLDVDLTAAAKDFAGNFATSTPESSMIHHSSSTKSTKKSNATKSLLSRRKRYSDEEMVSTPPPLTQRRHMSPAVDSQREGNESAVQRSQRDGLFTLVCRCNWPSTGLCVKKPAASLSVPESLRSSSSCSFLALSCSIGLVAERMEFVIFGMDRKTCRPADIERLLVEILADDSLTKWLPDALEFLRLSVVRRALLQHGVRPRNIGCVRTLDAVTGVAPTGGPCLPLERDMFGGDGGYPPSAPFGRHDDCDEQATNDEQSFLKQQSSMKKLANRYNIKIQVPIHSASASVHFSLAVRNARTEAAACARLAYELAHRLVSTTEERGCRLQCLYLESLECVAAIELAGIAMNVMQCTKMISSVATQMADVERRVFRACGGQKFNIDSPDEVAKILFVKLNLSAPQNATATKRHLSTNGAVLGQLKHPAAELIIRWRKLQNAHSTLRTLREEAIAAAKREGVVNDLSELRIARIRTCFDNVSAMAGRILSSRPNLQFLPKDPVVNDQFSVRSVIVASSGMILVAADYCQLELRVLCELSGDKRLSRLFAEVDDGGGDPFDRMAAYFQGNGSSELLEERITTNGKENVGAITHIGSENSAEKEDGSVTAKCDRQKAKQLCYAIIYGMGAETLSREMEINRVGAQALINRFFELFPRVKCWIDKRMEQCKRRGYCGTFMGRQRAFPSGLVGETVAHERRMGRQCINYIIQGTASEIFRQAMVDVDRQLDELFSRDQPGSARIVMQLHDELIVEVAESRATSCALAMRNAMERAFATRFRLRFPVKLSVGRNWGALRPMNVKS